MFAVPPLRGDEITRPVLMQALVEAVTWPGASAAGMTTALWGAGGFGKTTMARLLVHRAEVRERFPDGVVWVSVGDDAAGPELAEKVTSVVGLLGGERPAVTDPVAAGAELGRVLGSRQVLVVVDDVWNAAQLRRFPPLEPYATGMLDVGDGQSLYWECCGNPRGQLGLFFMAVRAEAVVRAPDACSIPTGSELCCSISAAVGVAARWLALRIRT